MEIQSRAPEKRAFSSLRNPHELAPHQIWFQRNSTTFQLLVWREPFTAAIYITSVKKKKSLWRWAELRKKKKKSDAINQTKQWEKLYGFWPINLTLQVPPFWHWSLQSFISEQEKKKTTKIQRLILNSLTKWSVFENKSVLCVFLAWGLLKTLLGSWRMQRKSQDNVAAK